MNAMLEQVVSTDDFRVFCVDKNPDALELICYYPKTLMSTRVRMSRDTDGTVQFGVFNGLMYEPKSASEVAELFQESIRNKIQGGILTNNGTYGYNVSYTYTANYTGPIVDTTGHFKEEQEANVARYIMNHFMPQNKEFVLPYTNSIRTVLNSLSVPLLQYLWKNCLNIDDIEVHYTKKSVCEIGKLKSFKDALRTAFGSDGPKLTKLVAQRLYIESTDAHYYQQGESDYASNGITQLATLAGTTGQVVGVSPATAYLTISTPQRIVKSLSLKVFNFGFLLKDLVPIDYIHEIVEKAKLIDVTENFNGFNGMTEVKAGMTDEIREFLKNFTPFKIKKIFLTMSYDSQLFDTAKQWAEHKNKIVLPEDFKELKEIHDIVSRQYRKYKEKNEPFVYPEEILALDNHKIDEDLVISLPKDVYELYDWGQEFDNCVASYKDKVLRKHTFIVAIRNNENKLKYCIDVADTNIREFKERHNKNPQNKEEELKVRNFLATIKFPVEKEEYSTTRNIFLQDGAGYALNQGAVYVNNGQLMVGGHPVVAAQPAALEVRNEGNGVCAINGANGQEIRAIPHIPNPRHNVVIENHLVANGDNV